MPAIQPEQLRKQSAELVAQFNNPNEFVRHLYTYLESYADRTYRSGKAGTHPSLIHAYGVRTPVLMQVVKDLSPIVKDNSIESIKLCDMLWEQPVLEFRQLCAYLLGLIDADSLSYVIDRMKLFIGKDTDELLIDALLSYGLSNARTNKPELVFGLVEFWFDLKDPYFQKIGLRALIPQSKEGGSKNLPVIYKLLQPYVRNHSLNFYPDLTELVDVLAQKSPLETGHFLSQTLELTNSADTAMLIRQCLKSFPPDIQENLKKDLRRFRNQQIGV